MGLSLAQIESVVGPIAAPLLENLWNSTLYPAIQKAASSQSPEIQVLFSAGDSFVNTVVLAELAKLQAL
jgi:hypothetical protein